MIEYEKKLKSNERNISVLSRKCDRCGYTKMDNDDDIWSLVGL